jgi:hypothetical protein
MVNYKVLYLEKEISSFIISRFVGIAMLLPAVTYILQFLLQGIYPKINLLFIFILLLAIMSPFKIIKATKKIKSLKKELNKELKGGQENE